MKTVMSLYVAIATATLLGGITGCAAMEADATPEDAAISAKVKQAFADHPAIAGENILVETDHGTVYLHGMVDSSFIANQAAEIAKVPGAKTVVNDLTASGS